MRENVRVLVDIKDIINKKIRRWEIEHAGKILEQKLVNPEVLQWSLIINLRRKNKSLTIYKKRTISVVLWLLVRYVSRIARRCDYAAATPRTQDPADEPWPDQQIPIELATDWQTCCPAPRALTPSAAHTGTGCWGFTSTWPSWRGQHYWGGHLPPRQAGSPLVWVGALFAR